MKTKHPILLEKQIFDDVNKYAHLDHFQNETVHPLHSKYQQSYSLGDGFVCTDHDIATTNPAKHQKSPPFFNVRQSKTSSPEVKSRQSVAIQAGENTQVPGHEHAKSLPLGVPFDFETELFKGRALIRFRNVSDGDKNSHDRYFEGNKRLMQTVIQGQFKKTQQFSNIYVGSVFKQALAQKPSAFISKVMDKSLRRVAPGVIMDLHSDKPKVISLYAGTAKTVSIDEPGDEPDIMSHDLRENAESHLGEASSSPEKRKKKFTSPKHTSQYEFVTDKVYTFHTYDENFDFSTGEFEIPMYGSFNVRQALGPQPMALSAVTSQDEVLYSFEVWHD